MANTKVSGVAGIASGLLAATDEFPVADASDLSVTYMATAANIKTFCTTAPVFAAGSASAGTWPLLTGGTVLGTAEDGAIEMDADCIYGCTDAGNRGYIPIRHFIRCDSTRTFTSNTNEQAIFTSPTNGRLTLETGVYLFKGMLYVTVMEAAATSNAAFDLLGAGTATCSSWLYHVVGIDGTPTTAASRTGSWSVTQQTVASMVTGVANANMAVQLAGTFKVTSAGTIIPSMTLAAASAAVVAIGSYITVERIGSTTVVSVGQWD